MKEILKLDTAQLYLRLEEVLSLEEEGRFWGLVRRRLSGEPLAYVTGHREFFALDFFVAPGVFIPRPESEVLVERALELAQHFLPDLLLADVGTGCGAIAISLALRFPQAQIYATDISFQALEVARRNCYRYGLEDRIQLLQGNLLQPLPRPVHLILANLPYVPEEELNRLPEEIGCFEPLAALSGGPDGLKFIRALLSGAKSKLLPSGALLFEIALGQAQNADRLAEECFPQARVEILRDLSDLERVIVIQTSK